MKQILHDLILRSVILLLIALIFESDLFSKMERSDFIFAQNKVSAETVSSNNKVKTSPNSQGANSADNAKKPDKLENSSSPKKAETSKDHSKTNNDSVSSSAGSNGSDNSISSSAGSEGSKFSNDSVNASGRSNGSDNLVNSSDDSNGSDDPINVSGGSAKSKATSESETLSPLDRQNLESVSKSLKKKQKFPWYSNKSGELKFLPPRPEKPVKTPSNNQNTFNWNTLFNGILWIILITIFIFLVIALVLILLHLKNKKSIAKNNDSNQPDDLRRQRESLPVEAAQKIGSLDLLAESSMKEGDFRKAIIYHFSWLLIELDRRKIIHLQKDKTNRQLLSEIKFRNNLATLYRHVMDLFEKTYYGALPISEEDFLTVWQERDLLRSEMNQPTQNPPIFPPQNNNSPQRNNNSPQRNNNSPQRNFHSFFLIVFMTTAFCLISCAGCRSKYWSEEYTANYSPNSINGISIFSDMIKSRDHEVTISEFCDNPDDYDVIFWCSRIGTFPGRESREILSCLPWLEEKEGRKIFLFLHDGQADYDFWTEMQKIAPSDQQNWVKEKIQDAKSAESLIQNRFEQDYNRDIKGRLKYYKKNSKKNNKDSKEKNKDNKENKNVSNENINDDKKSEENSNNFGGVKNKKKSDHSKSPVSSVPGVSQEDLAELHKILISDFGPDSNNWLICKPLKKVETSSKLTGPMEWAGGLEPEFPYRFTKKIELGPDYQVLVAAGDVATGEIPLITRTTIGKSDLYVISSRLFLLNYPLLKKDRQILAGRLINSLGSKPRNVLIALETIYFSSGKNRPKPLPAIFSTKPFAVLFWHLVFLAVLLTFRGFPILGRPREIPPEERADFSKHLTAFADLLEKTGNRSWAEKNIGLYLKQKENEQTKQ